VVEVAINFGRNNALPTKAESVKDFIVRSLFNCRNPFDYTVVSVMVREGCDSGSDVFGNTLTDWNKLNAWNEVARNDLQYHSIG
jgi:hypothetical protein